MKAETKKKILWGAGFVFAIILIIRGFSAQIAWRQHGTAMELQLLKGMSAEYLLTPGHAKDLPAPLGQEFAVTDTGTILIRAGEELLETELEGRLLKADKLNTTGPGPDSFALDDSAVLTVSGPYFGQLENGVPTKAIPLPAMGMKLAPSQLKGVVYLYGGSTETSRRLYALKEDGTFAILAELPSPIVAVADSLNSLYLATGREILRIRGEKVDLVTRLPDGEVPLTSLTVSEDDKVVYFATASEVYALHGAVALAVVKNSGGILRRKGGALYLWDQSRSLLVKLVGLDAALFAH